MTAPPASLDAVADVVRRSRLVADDRLAVVLAAFRAGGRDPAHLLAELTAADLLTPFQATQLARGKWKGFVLGTHYRLLDKLGSGGMGTVYLAEHSALRKRVAVKVLAPELVADPVALKRFTREARAAAAIDHPNVVHVIDVDPDASPPFLVMEYVDGLTLQAAVAATGTFPAESAAFCGVQALLGLQRAHQTGLVHRDVKPANVIVDRKGAVKLLDLGIVWMDTGEGLTNSGGKNRTILGTVDYLAPEQAVDSSAVDTRADVYALGSTVYFLLAGHPPFPDGGVGRKLMLKQTAEPAPVHTLRPDVPDGMSAVLARMLARDPADRYPTPGAAVEALAPFAAPEPGFPARLFGLTAAVSATPPPVGRLTADDAPPPPPGMAGGSNLHFQLPPELPARPRGWRAWLGQS